MGPLDIFFHLLGFAAPALAVGLLVSLAARLAARGGAAGRWWLHAAANAVVGICVLAAGLVFFGVDGKMATYAALVLACATSQWVVGRSWRR